jgi:hypothetical protein
LGDPVEIQEMVAAILLGKLEAARRRRVIG